MVCLNQEIAFFQKGWRMKRKRPLGAATRTSGYAGSPRRHRQPLFRESSAQILRRRKRRISEGTIAELCADVPKLKSEIMSCAGIATED